MGAFLYGSCYGRQLRTLRIIGRMVFLEMRFKLGKSVEPLFATKARYVRFEPTDNELFRMVLLQMSSELFTRTVEPIAANRARELRFRITVSAVFDHYGRMPSFDMVFERTNGAELFGTELALELAEKRPGHAREIHVYVDVEILVFRSVRTTATVWTKSLCVL